MTNKLFRKQLGNLGEEIAKNFLIKRGFKIMETNYHYSRAAEVDIIALKNNILHFIEVKTRSSEKFGTPYEAVTQKKLRLIYSGAMYYIQNVVKKYQRFQIDVVGVILKEGCEPEITFLQNVSF